MQADSHQWQAEMLSAYQSFQTNPSKRLWFSYVRLNPPENNDTNPIRIALNLQLHDYQQGELLPGPKPRSSPRRLWYY